MHSLQGAVPNLEAGANAAFPSPLPPNLFSIMAHAGSADMGTVHGVLGSGKWNRSLPAWRPSPKAQHRPPSHPRVRESHVGTPITQVQQQHRHWEAALCTIHDKHQ